MKKLEDVADVASAKGCKGGRIVGGEFFAEERNIAGVGQIDTAEAIEEGRFAAT